MVTMNKSTSVKIAGPVVTKSGKATKATQAMLATPVTKKTRKVAVVIVEKLKNPIQIRHIRAVIQPSGKFVLKGTDKVTSCGRIVCSQMTRKNPPIGKTVQVCPHCLDASERTDRAFQIVRGAVKLRPVLAANKS